MPDVDHLWGNDIGIGPTGDIGIVDGLPLGNQRVIRRLMTRGAQAAAVNVPATTGELLYHQPYGAGIPLRIGRPTNVTLIKSVVRSQILQESAVAKAPAPIITVASFTNGVTTGITYTVSVNGEQSSLSFDVNQ